MHDHPVCEVHHAIAPAFEIAVARRVILVVVAVARLNVLADLSLNAPTPIGFHARTKRNELTQQYEWLRKDRKDKLSLQEYLHKLFSYYRARRDNKEVSLIYWVSIYARSSFPSLLHAEETRVGSLRLAADGEPRRVLLLVLPAHDDAHLAGVPIGHVFLFEGIGVNHVLPISCPFQVFVAI